MHSKQLHGKKNQFKKNKVQKVLAKRDSEILCELESFEPTVEWIEEEDVELGFFEIPQVQNEYSIPIISDLHEWLTSPFRNCE